MADYENEDFEENTEAQEPQEFEDQEEYEFQEGGDTDYEYYDVKDSDSKTPKLKKRSIIIVVGAIVVLAGLYQAYNMIFGEGPKAPKTQSTEQTNHQQSQKMHQKHQQLLQQQHQQETQQQNKHHQEESKHHQQLKQLIQARKQQQQSHHQQQQSHNENIQSDIKAIRQQNSKILNELGKGQFGNQTSIMQINNHLKNLNKKINQVSAELAKLKNVHTKTSSNNNNAASSANNQQNHQGYFVEAVIPGRAWLQAADGTTTTVSKGDTLPGYGKVKSINSYSGTVKTTRGLIPYGVSANSG